MSSTSKDGGGGNSPNSARRGARQRTAPVAVARQGEQQQPDGADVDLESRPLLTNEAAVLTASGGEVFPRQVFFIFGSELCERFSYYGLGLKCAIRLRRLPPAAA